MVKYLEEIKKCFMQIKGFEIHQNPQEKNKLTYLISRTTSDPEALVPQEVQL